MLENILLGATIATEPVNLLAALVGVFLGVIVGALPGLTTTMGVALLIPVSYGMPPVTALILLGGVYAGGMYGGSIAAILVNTPGTPSAAATVFDGYPMAQKGQAKQALVEAAVASHWGGQMGTLALLLIAPPLAAFSLRFGPQESFMLGVFGLTMIASLAGKDMIKGLIGGLLGMLLGSVGMDPQYGFARYTFGQIALLTGIPLVPALVGLFSISQILNMIVNKAGTVSLDKSLGKINQYKFSLRDLFMHPKIYFICGIVGVFIGIIPAVGGSIVAFMGYDVAKRISKNPEEFGTGRREGVAGPETANSAQKGGTMIPMLTLGIPGNPLTAVLLGALMIHGLTPGHDLFTVRAAVTYPFIVGMFIANFMVLMFGLFCAEQFAKVNRIPLHFLVMSILVLTVIGSFAVNNSYPDVFVMLIIGILGYFMRRMGYEMAPVVLGIILGPIVERGFMRTLIINGNNLTPTLLSFVTRPISLVLLVLSILCVVAPLYADYRANKAKEAA